MTADHIIEKIRPLVREIKENLNGPPYVTVLSGVIIDALDAIDALAAERDALRKALEPFKAFAAAYDEDQLRRNGVDPRKYDLSDKATVATSGIFGTSTWRVITAGDCRRARTLAGDNHE